MTAAPTTPPPTRAALHTRAHMPAHPDSEEATRHEARRVSRELSFLHDRDTPHSAQPTSSVTSLRSRNAASSQASHEPLQRHDSRASNAQTAPSGDADAPPQQSVHSSPHAPQWYTAWAKCWTAHMSPVVDQGALRDHLALERTFLAYLRSSLLLVMTGVLIAQLFRLQHSASPDPVFGFYAVGKGLSVAFIGAGVMVVGVGAVRFWRLQGALLRGKAVAGGWEVNSVMGGCAVLLVATGAVVLGVVVQKGVEEDSGVG
ncbi:hypothetical protein ACN47E_007678 [Coniothyrium glycines]